MKINISDFKKHIEDGLIMSNRHWSLPLSIYNYTQYTQFNKKWDNITSQCRGLIVDDNNVVVAKPFSKFFNYEELDSKIVPWNEIPMISDKEDGSLGIIFNYNDEWMVATRGSFASDQAIKAAEILKNYNVGRFNPNYTYLAEIIYPENRIVLDYGKDERLIFLGAFDIKNNRELFYVECIKEFLRIDIPYKDIIRTNAYPDAFGPDAFKKLKENQKDNKEGYVIKFEPSGFRFKIKFEDYIRLHRIVTNFNEKALIKILSEGQPIPEELPDEFYRPLLNDLQPRYDYVKKLCDKEYDSVSKLESRKEQALYIQANIIPRYQGVMFARLDGRKWENQIWKLI